MAVFETALLPSEVKEDLVRTLLSELGVTSVSRHGQELEMLCPMPWHDDRNPSASFNFEKLVFSCWSCHASGGLLWFIATTRGQDWQSARTWIATETGLGGEGTEFDLSALLSLFDALYDDKRTHSVPPIPRFAERVLDPWSLVHPWLTDPVEEGGRGIPVQNVKDLRVGYAEQYPMGPNNPPSERIVIPHFWKGSLVGWQSRRLDASDGTPKYLSTPDFPKDRSIYRYDRKAEQAVVVESPMSVLRHCHHLPMEATFGSELPDAQVRLLAAHERVVLWMDNDPAGWWATAGRVTEQGEWLEGLGERLSRYTEVSVVDSDWAADPADLDEETAAALVAAAVPYAVWQPPERLRCWLCKAYHSGACSPGEEDTVGFTKHGEGEIMPEKNDLRRDASKDDVNEFDWHDQQELAIENKQTDQADRQD